MIDEIQQVREFADVKWAEGRAEGVAEGRQSGLAEGEIKAKRDVLLRLVTRVGIALTDQERTRILSCAETASLDRWLDNAIGARSAAELFR